MVFATAAIPYAQRFHLRFWTACGIYLSFVMLLSLALLPGLVRVSRKDAKAQSGWTQFGWYRASFFVALCVPYLLYSAATGDFRVSAALRVTAVIAIPALLYLTFPPRDSERFGGADLCNGLFLIAVVLSGWLRNIWSVPVNLDFMSRLLLIAAMSMTWTVIRPVPELHYRLEFTRKVIKAAAVNFVYFALIAIPAGLLIGFTAWHPRWRGMGQFALDYLEIFLFIALLEEMFFRGFLQSLLSRSMGSTVRAQVAVSLLFGLFHILHAPFPNWRYVALASVAGWFYGEAYRRGGSLLASSLTHAMVDTVWRTWLSKG